MPIVTRAKKPEEPTKPSKGAAQTPAKKEAAGAATLHTSKTRFLPVLFDAEGKNFLKPDPSRPAPGGTQEYYRLRADCLSKGTLFEDPDFPADDTSIHLTQQQCKHTHYKWLRPQEICPEAIFANNGFSRFAVQQGALGDCWLLAAAANLTIFPVLFHRVVPEDNDAIRGGKAGVDYAGIFHFRFWRFGQWYDVVIDDRLPTQNGRLVYIQSTQNEFWSALLEKAYAKLFGTYEALVGGSASEAMEDFTGGVTESYAIQQAPPNLFELIERGCNSYAMFACSVRAVPGTKEVGTPQGLITGHAYSITKAQTVDIKTPRFQGRVSLLRLRNPWGNEKEWNGAWSDQSAEWKFIDDATKRTMGLTFENDGEFWMSFADFGKYFDKIEMCHLTPDCPIVKSDGRFSWKTAAFEGEWVRGSTAGGCSNFLDTFWHNPQYVIRLETPDEGDAEQQSTMIVSLIQKNRRSKRNKGISCLPIGYELYRVEPGELQQKPLPADFFQTRPSAADTTFINLRENTARFRLQPGTYVIVPSTFDRNDEGEFLIRVFSESPNNMQENDSAIGISEPADAPSTPGMPQKSGKDVDESETKSELAAMEKLFHEVAGEDGEVDWMELKMVLDRCFERDIAKASEGILQTYKSRGTAPYKAPVKQETLLERAYLSNSGFSKDACRSMVAMLDDDGSGKLGLTEFQKLLTDIGRWKGIFERYDLDHNGHLSPFELRSALESAGFTLNNHIINRLMHRYSSKEAQIWFDDFITCAVKIRTMFDIFHARDADKRKEIRFTLEDWISQTIYS